MDGFLYKTFLFTRIFWKLYKFCGLVIEYVDSARFTEDEGNFLQKIDAEVWKYGVRIGFVTLVVHTVKYEYVAVIIANVGLH